HVGQRLPPPRLDIPTLPGRPRRHLRRHPGRGAARDHVREREEPLQPAGVGKHGVESQSIVPSLLGALRTGLPPAIPQEVPMPSLSRTLATWAAGLRYEDLPPQVIDRARGVTLHGLASALLGARMP